MRNYRAVPVEVLRAWYAEQQDHSSLRALSLAAGVGRTTLHKFVSGRTDPYPRTRRLLALHYLTATGATNVMVAEALVALAKLLPGISPSRAADELASIYARCGVDPPPWWCDFVTVLHDHQRVPEPHRRGDILPHSGVSPKQPGHCRRLL